MEWRFENFRLSVKVHVDISARLKNRLLSLKMDHIRRIDVHSEQYLDRPCDRISE